MYDRSLKETFSFYLTFAALTQSYLKNPLGSHELVYSTVILNSFAFASKQMQALWNASLKTLLNDIRGAVHAHLTWELNYSIFIPSLRTPEPEFLDFRNWKFSWKLGASEQI